VHDLEALGPGRHPAEEGLVEPTGTEQGGVDEIGATAGAQI
jgi:hypothetical protein